MPSERQEYNSNSPWWGEHIHRYYETLKHITGGIKILDLACGNGFGSEILSNEGKNVVIGADINEEAIKECKKNFPYKNLTFEIIDGTNMPYENETFGLVTSFETIEHTKDYEKMLKEFFRVLKPKGICIISTPNIKINSPNGIIENPFHTQEFNYNELKNILDDVFNAVSIYGQKYIRYKNKNTIIFFLARHIERFLYLKGIRKTPLSIQNFIMKFMIGKNLYPSAYDYAMINDKKEIEKCKTFFAICRKK